MIYRYMRTILVYDYTDFVLFIHLPDSNAFFFQLTVETFFLLIPDLSWVCCSMTPSQIVDRITSVSVLLTPRRTQDELNRHTHIAETVGLNMGQTQPGATPDAHTDTRTHAHPNAHSHCFSHCVGITDST